MHRKREREKRTRIYLYPLFHVGHLGVRFVCVCVLGWGRVMYPSH